MRKSWLLCVLLGALAWGQAQPETKPETKPAAPSQAPGAETKPEAKPAAADAKPAKDELPPTAVVLTIVGVCPPAPKPAAGAKPAGAKKPADCMTQITRAQFEKIEHGISFNPTPQLERQLESALPRFMAMSEAAKKKGMENTDYYRENLKMAKMQILTNALQHAVQEQADKVPQSEIDEYYKKNPEAYEQFSLDRLFIPRHKTVSAEEQKEEAKEAELTEEQQKTKEADEKAKQEKSDEELTKLADTLRARAAAGEDFIKLQKEAFEAAGSKVENPNVNLPKVRRTGLPPAHVAVFDLKANEVSAVISDAGGHYIYKVVSKEVLPLDQVSMEIHNKLKSEHLKEMMDKYTTSFTAVPNEKYFGAAPAPGPQRPHGARAPMAPPPAAPKAQPQGAQAAPPAAQPASPAKSN